MLLEGEGNDNPGIKMKLDRVENLVILRFDDVSRLIKFLGWMIGTALVLLGLWFTSLELRQKIDAEMNAPVVSSKHMPQVAGDPPGYIFNK